MSEDTTTTPTTTPTTPTGPTDQTTAATSTGGATTTSADGGVREVRGDEPVATAPRPRRRTGSGGFFAAWIGIGAIVGGLAGVVLAATTEGPALVSTERSFMWLGVFFACLGALVGAVAAVLVDSAAHGRRRERREPPHDGLPDAPSGR